MPSLGKNGKSIDKVNSISDYTRHLLTRDALQDITHFKLLLSWWKEKSKEKHHIPSRKDFNPVNFKSVLPSIAIFDPIFREGELVDLMPTLIGTGLTGVYGEATGKLISAFENEYLVQGLLGASRECLQKREPIGITAKAVSDKLPFMRSFALYCPLATDHTHIDKLLVQVSFE